MKKKNNPRESNIVEKEVVAEKKETKKPGKFDPLGRFSAMNQEEKICLGLLVVLGLIVMYIRSKFALMPFERDEGTYGYYGKLLLEGGIPYKDFYEQKFPGLFYFYAFMVGVFGDTVKGLHTGFMYLNVVTMVLIYATSRKLFNPVAGIISAATFAFVSLTPMLSGFTVQGEHGVAFFTSLGFYFYAHARASQSWKHYLAMGLALGAAFMVKTSGIFLLAAGGLIIISDFFLTPGKKDFKALFIRAFTYGGSAISVVLVLFLIIYMKGAFEDMIYWAYKIPKRYVSRVPWEEGKKYLDFTYQAVTNDYKFFWRHAFLGLAVCLIKGIDLRTKAFGFILIAFSCGTIVPGFYFYGHYWIQILPGLSILAGLTCFSILTLLKTRLNIKFKGLGYAYILVFAFFIIGHVSKLQDYYFRPNYERILRSVYGNNPFPESMEIANFINREAKPEDGLVVMGSEPEMYFYTKKRCPSRHAYFSAMVDNVPEHKAWQREFVKDVEAAKPKYFVFYNHQISLFVQPGTDNYVFEWANKFISANYQLIGLVDMIEGQRANYVWRENVNTYKPQSPTYIMVFERKS
jgi:hypothetical protein